MILGTKQAVINAIEAGKSVWFVEAWSSAYKTHRVGHGYVAAANAVDAKAACNQHTASRGEKLFGDFGFGAGHIKTARQESRESIARALLA